MPHSPWTFHRDEVDLLEEDIDEIYDAHQSEDGHIHTMEQAMIEEQLDTEEQADVDFEQKMDLTWLLKPRSEKFSWESRTDPIDDEPDISCDASRPPFYEQVFRFAEQVYAFASETYRRDDHIKHHAFRVLVNVKMIPIKCANAISDDLRGDQISSALSKKEFNLAVVYLDRILISLAFMAAEGDASAQTFLAPGIRFKKMIQEHLTRRSNDHRGFSS